MTFRVQVFDRETGKARYEADLINVFWNAMMHEEFAAITSDGDIWTVPLNTISVKL